VRVQVPPSPLKKVKYLNCKRINY